MLRLHRKIVSNKARRRTMLRSMCFALSSPRRRRRRRHFLFSTAWSIALIRVRPRIHTCAPLPAKRERHPHANGAPRAARLTPVSPSRAHSVVSLPTTYTPTPRIRPRLAPSRLQRGEERRRIHLPVGSRRYPFFSFYLIPCKLLDRVNIWLWHVPSQ